MRRSIITRALIAGLVSGTIMLLGSVAGRLIGQAIGGTVPMERHGSVWGLFVAIGLVAVIGFVARFPK